MSRVFDTCDPTNVATPYYDYANTEIRALKGGPASFHFSAGMAIDADGAPNAYHPEDIEDALDYLRFAGRPGNWWAVVTDNDQPNGRPVIQSSNDPYPGYYISMTTLEDKTKPRTDPSRYVNASIVPYFVLPEEVARKFGAAVGDFGVVIKKAAHGREEKVVSAIFADLGPPGRLGEGSIALAQTLGIPFSPKTGGLDKGIEYIVFPGSGNGQPRSLEEISTKGRDLLQSYQQLRHSLCPESDYKKRNIGQGGP